MSQRKGKNKEIYGKGGEKEERRRDRGKEKMGEEKERDRSTEEKLKGKKEKEYQVVDLKWMPEVLVLGAGGVKGFLEMGALLHFKEEGYLEGIKVYAGTSVGAIISLLLVCGYTVTEIIAEAVDMTLFQDISMINLSQIKNYDGAISNKPIREKLSRLVKDKFGFIPDLRQLFMFTAYKLVCVTLNLDTDTTEYLSYETEPSISCIDAVLLSMNIPFLFYKLKYKGCLYIDGAFGNSYPIDQFDDGNVDVLGLYINSNGIQKIPSDETKIRYLYKTLDASMIQIRKRIIENSSPRCKHLQLFCNNYDPIGISTTIKDRSKMVMDGYIAAKNFILAIKGKEKRKVVIRNESDHATFLSTKATPNLTDVIEQINNVSESSHSDDSDLDDSDLDDSDLDDNDLDNSNLDNSDLDNSNLDQNDNDNDNDVNDDESDDDNDDESDNDVNDVNKDSKNINSDENNGVNSSDSKNINNDNNGVNSSDEENDDESDDNESDDDDSDDDNENSDNESDEIDLRK